MSIFPTHLVTGDSQVRKECGAFIVYHEESVLNGAGKALSENNDLFEISSIRHTLMNHADSHGAEIITRLVRTVKQFAGLVH